MNYLEYEKSLKKSTIQPMYVFYGEESFLKHEAMNLLKDRLGENLFFKEYEIGDSFNVESLMSDLQSDVLFDDRSLIILKDADSVVTSLAAPLEKYLKAPNENSILALILNKLDGRSKFAKMANQKGVCVECKAFYDRPKPWLNLPPWENDLVKWLCQRVKKHQKNITKQAAFLLTEYSGKDLKDLDSQLQKLALFVKERENIEESDIEAMVHTSKRASVFDFLDAVCEHDLPHATKLLRQIFANGIQGQDGNPIYNHTHISLQLLRMLHYRTKQIWKVVITGESVGQQFVQKKLMAFAPHFSKQHLIRTWQAIAETEYQLKTSGQSPALAVEQLVFKIFSNKQIRH